MWSNAYWKATGERAAKTFVQTLIPTVSLALLAPPDWASLGSAVGAAACASGISILTSMASTLRGDPDSPSLLTEPTGRHARPD